MSLLLHDEANSGSAELAWYFEGLSHDRPSGAKQAAEKLANRLALKEHDFKNSPIGLL
jgi:hypothetical protein